LALKINNTAHVSSLNKANTTMKGPGFPRTMCVTITGLTGRHSLMMRRIKKRSV